MAGYAGLEGDLQCGMEIAPMTWSTPEYSMPTTTSYDYRAL